MGKDAASILTKLFENNKEIDPILGFIPFYFEAGKWACIRSGSVKFALLVQLKEILMKLNSGIHFKLKKL
ncbi:hypothetical protein CEXT_690001 [Caerostris extrusa]|uniref:LAGLIDADG homing endonuclease n=1 Tax=Caerostris extrusa TaxID=172846 RepID=A0AAV4NIG5_CAEEX|nr:hypothetical protein CEXT_690001 [Caerostris extrusa]